MCNTFDEYWNRGLEQGRKETGQIKKVIKILFESGRNEDLQRALDDDEYLQQLLKEFIPATNNI